MKPREFTVTMPASPADTVAGAYARGVAEGLYRGDLLRGHLFAPINLRTSEIRDAINSWTNAQNDHSHTSFWGAFHIRAMRAYWLGRIRAQRQRA